jgi:hypothetical protein
LFPSLAVSRCSQTASSVILLSSFDEIDVTMPPDLAVERKGSRTASFYTDSERVRLRSRFEAATALRSPDR